MCNLGGTGGTDRDPLRSLAICGQVEFGRIVGIQSALIPAVRSSDQDAVSYSWQRAAFGILLALNTA